MMSLLRIVPLVIDEWQYGTTLLLIQNTSPCLYTVVR
jgi:hypothetical protein